ncbi:MAG: hypothetical protein O2856_13610, partial [Planctomycetota bacterium]|nr:hypothetical protein [Planctomycetota bacterium]
MNRKPSSTISSNTQPAVSIPTVLRSRCTAARNVPIVAGLCVPKGFLADAFTGHIDGFRSLVPTQFDVLNRWNDGSVRWMLASSIAPEVSRSGSGLNVCVFTEPGVESDQPEYGVTTVKGTCGEICIVTRDLTADPPTEQILRLMPYLCDIDGTELPLQIHRIREEVSGSIRRVYIVHGCVQSKPFVTLQLRLTHWVAAGLLQVETRIRNSRRARHSGGLWDLGDTGSFVFGSLEIAISSDNIPDTAVTHWKAQRDHVFQSTSQEIFLRQHNSGGPTWNSTNHVSASGQVDVKERGYAVSNDDHASNGDRAETTILV